MEIIHKKAAIQKALSAIGVKNGSSPPEHNDNRFRDAYELFVASELRSAANKRYEAAKARAADTGVIDEEKTVEGSEISTYVSKYFDVTMKKASSSTTLDKTMLANEMAKRGMKDEDVKSIIAAASKPRKGAVTIGFTLKG